MGWNEGQGLGKSNQGRLDPVTLKVKNDAKGVGYQGRAEAVLAHQVSLCGTLNLENDVLPLKFAPPCRITIIPLNLYRVLTTCRLFSG